MKKPQSPQASSSSLTVPRASDEVTPAYLVTCVSTSGRRLGSGQVLIVAQPGGTTDRKQTAPTSYDPEASTAFQTQRKA